MYMHLLQYDAVYLIHMYMYRMRIIYAYLEWQFTIVLIRTAKSWKLTKTVVEPAEYRSGSGMYASKHCQKWVYDSINSGTGFFESSRIRDSVIRFKPIYAFYEQLEPVLAAVSRGNVSWIWATSLPRLVKRGVHGLHAESDDKGTRVANFAADDIMVFSSTFFEHLFRAQAT